MQLGFNLWAWTWCNISRPRKSGTLGGGTGGTCGARCPGTFAFLEPKEFLEPVELHRFQTGSTTLWFPTFHTGSLGSTRHWFHRFQTGSLGSTVELWELWRVWISATVQTTTLRLMHHCAAPFRSGRGYVFDRNAEFRMPFTNRNHATGSTGSRQVPWVQPRHWFHSFQTGSLGSNMQWFHRFHTGFLGSTRHWFHRFQTGSLGSTVELWELWRVWISATVQTTTLRLMHHCAAPFRSGRGYVFDRNAEFRMPFTNRNHATGSTGSRQVPWVQPRHWFHSFQTGSLGSNTQWFHRFHTGFLGSTRHWFHRFQTSSLGSTTLWVQQVEPEPKEPVWNRPRHWFHRFQTGSLGSTVELWELWRVWITKQWFCLMYR